MTKTKVFGIGFHKTGTSSLATALDLLGYRVTGPNKVDDPEIGTRYVDIAREVSPDFDAFQDNPWPLVFREMDEMWPSAKFILTTRTTEKWLASQVNHFGTKTTAMRTAIYGPGAGCPVGNEARYVEVFEAHNRAVRAHFAQRPQDLLDFDLTQTPDWKILCDFLGEPVPADVPFPFKNAARPRKSQA